MSKIRLAVLFGGVSGEHEVSCRSALSVLTHLDRSRYDLCAIGIARDGHWFLQAPWTGGPVSVDSRAETRVTVVPGGGLEVQGRPLPLDVVFPVVHGIRGEDGALQGLLTWAGLPCVGAGILASALGMDKAFAKQIWSALGLPVVPSRTLTAAPADPEAEFERCRAVLGLPLFVKPSNSGSSVGVTKVTSGAGFGPALDRAFAVDGRVLVETAVDAREIEVAVLGAREPRAYGPGEVVPRHEFYDYDAKYVDPDGADLVIPADLPGPVTARVLDLAVEAYRALGTEGYARVDFFVARTGSQVWLNEINTLPGFTTISMFPRMAVAGGLTYPHLLDHLVDLALGARA